MRDLTVIIPTWNQGRYLTSLFDSIVDSPVAACVEEILFVCDRSTDGSEAIIAGLIARQDGGKLPRVRMIQPAQRRGLFMARYLAAKAATTKRILFMDSRITLPASSAQALPALLAQYPAMVANLDIDVTKNLYCLYWQRSHEIFYRRSETVSRAVHIIDSANFATIRVGGTCFYCGRDLFNEVSERYLDRPLLSDDTAVFEDMLKVQPMVMHPDFRVQWEPRDTAKVFLKHLYGRGPGFAEYHLFRKRGKLYWSVVLGAGAGLVVVATSLVYPLVGLGLALSCLALFALSTALIARGVREFIRLAPLHTAVIMAYGFGALRGAWVVWRRQRSFGARP